MNLRMERAAPLGFSSLSCFSLLSFDSQDPRKIGSAYSAGDCCFGFNFLFGLCSYFVVLFFDGSVGAILWIKTDLFFC